MRRIIVLIGSIFFMAGVYDVIWNFRPDYFRVQSGVNFLPLDLVQIASAYSSYSNKEPLPEILSQANEDASAKRIEEAYRRFQAASAALVQKKSELESRSQQDSREYSVFEKDQWAQYEAFVAAKTAAFRDQMNVLSDSMRKILSDSNVSSGSDLPPGPEAVEYAQLAVKLANLDVERTKGEVEARENGLRNLTQFQTRPEQKEYLSRHRSLDAFRTEVLADQSAADKLHRELYQAFLDYRNATATHLGYGDFLYFSVGAATTATFGDISPNSTSVRLLVCLQVLGSIVFTGLLVNALASGHH
jgi:Ion channel